MIPFEEIDAVLKSLGKDRAWLASESGRKPDSIRVALATNADPKNRSELLQKALTDAIKRERDRQAEAQRSPFDEPPEIPAGHTAIYLTGQTYEDAERASRIVGSPTLADFCRDVIKTQARLILEQTSGKSPESSNLSLVADSHQESSPSTPAPTVRTKYPHGKTRRKNGTD